jgi:hypothetical protein
MTVYSPLNEGTLAAWPEPMPPVLLRFFEQLPDTCLRCPGFAPKRHLHTTPLDGRLEPLPTID